MQDIAEEFETAKALVAECPQAPTTSYLQRKMRVGYSKAAQLVEMLIEEKVLERDEREPWMLRVI